MHFTLMDITLPTWIVVSQWVLLFALGFLVITMYRQIALIERLKDTNADREGLRIGDVSPSFEYIPAKHGTDVPARFEPKGQWSLLVFGDPSCVSCQNTVLALDRIAPKLGSMRILVATTADPGQIAASEAFGFASVDIGRIPSEVAINLYHTSTTPFGYLIDPEGVTQAKGVVTDEASLRKLIRQGDDRPVNVAFSVSK